MLNALTELATTSAEELRGKHLEAEDFDKLFSGDPVKDILLWLNDPAQVTSSWNAGRWSAFKSRSKEEFKFDPEKDGVLVAAELMGQREGHWASVWGRFAESPRLYPGVPEHLRKAMPSGLFIEPSSWPQNHEEEETELRRALIGLEDTPPAVQRGTVCSSWSGSTARGAIGSGRS